MMKFHHVIKYLIKLAGIAAVIGLASLGICLPAEAAVSGSSLINKPAPAFTLKALDGRATSLAQLKGKVVFLDFWMPG